MTEQASTTQTTQSSDGQQGQSTQQSAEASSGGSQTTQTQPAARPEWLPEPHWDTATNAIKPEFGDHYKELSGLKASHDARIAARPEKADGYELKFPDGYTPPIPLKFDPADPEFALAQELAYEASLSQEQFSKLLTKKAEIVAARAKAANDFHDAEMKKLGANGTARVTASKAWATSILGEKRAGRLFNLIEEASDFEAFEDLQKAFTTQGGGALNGKGREPPPPAAKPLADKLWPNRPAQ